VDIEGVGEGEILREFCTGYLKGVWFGVWNDIRDSLFTL